MSQNDTTRLLVINDQEDEVERLLSMLRNSGRNTRAQHVPSEEGLEKLLSDQAWDLMIALDSSKSCDPKAALRIIRKLDKDVPVIFQTEAMEEERAIALIEGLKAGARDVVTYDDDQHLLIVMNRELQNLEERRQRRSADRKHREAERRCQQLLNSSRNAIAYMEDGLFLYVNDSFAERFGYEDADDLLGMSFIDMIGKKDQGTYKTFMKEFSLNENPGTQELTLQGITQDGSEFPITMAVARGVYEEQPCIELSVAASAIDTAELEEKLRAASNIDVVTGLFNRQHFTDVLNSAIRDAAENDKYRSLHLISIDRFDSLRTEIGLTNFDNFLKNFAAVLKSSVDDGAVLSRFSDDEFVLLLPGTDEEQQVQKAKAVCKKVEESIISAGDKTAQTTVSIGICPITERVTNPDEVLTRAHQAAEDVLHVGKKGIGNNAKYFVPKAVEGSQDAKLLLEIIDLALQKDRFELLFHPVISLRGDETEHYEVLIQMLPDEDGNTMPTAQMFTALNQSPELNKKIDRWVILNASKALGKHRAAGHNTKLFINLAGASLKDTELVKWTGVALKAADLPADAIYFQFSESDAVNYLNDAKRLADEIAQAGSKCCMKNFGCALDPYKALQHINVPMIKLDGSFTNEIQHKNEKPDNIKKMITQLNGMNKESIVPFVENAAVIATLWQSGAHFIQGHYFSKPEKTMSFVFQEE